MAKRKAKSKAKSKARKKAPRKRKAAAKPDAVSRICFERIVPDHLDPSAAARRGTRDAVEAIGTLDASQVLNVARMAVVTSKKWPVGGTLKCRFLDGSATMKRKVEAKAHIWEKYANVKFKFVTSGAAEIRISFYADSGSWSAVGNDALIERYFPLHQPTMNYGWLRDDTDNKEYSRVVIHEFGHALGCIHEHQSPNFTRVWNKERVLQEFSGPPNNWTKEEIIHNVLAKYSPKGVAATKIDPASIMLYTFSGDLFADGLGGTNSNSRLSPMDEGMIREMYPF